MMIMMMRRQRPTAATEPMMIAISVSVAGDGPGIEGDLFCFVLFCFVLFCFVLF